MVFREKKAVVATKQRGHLGGQLCAAYGLPATLGPGASLEKPLDSAPGRWGNRCEGGGVAFQAEDGPARAKCSRNH